MDRLYVELAIATQIPASEWRNETDEVIATAIRILEEQAAESKRKK